MKVVAVALPVAFVGLLAFAHPAQAASIPVTILNNSFELPDLVSPGAFQACPITNWTCTPANSAGVYVATTTQYASGSNGLTGGKIVPDGDQAAYTAGADLLSQFTAATFVAGNTYTLDVWGGCRGDNSFCTGFGSAVSLQLLGNTIATTVSSATLTGPARGFWKEYQLVYTAVAADQGKTIGVGLTSTSSTQQINWDLVTLTYTEPVVTTPTIGGAEVPEPASLVLLGSGLLGAAWYRRRRKNS